MTAQSVNRATEDAEPPSWLSDVPHVMLAGDVGRAITTSVQWVHELVARGELRPSGRAPKWRQGRWEWFLVFEPAEVERYIRSRGKQRVTREPRQLRLLMAIPGGKARS